MDCPTAVAPCEWPGCGEVGFELIDGLGEASPRLLICSGDHPLADEEMMLSLAAREAAEGVLCSLSRLAGDDGCEDILGESSVVT